MNYLPYGSIDRLLFKDMVLWQHSHLNLYFGQPTMTFNILDIINDIKNIYWLGVLGLI